MRAATATAWLVGVLIGLTACVSPLQRGERLYRQGDLRGALEAWRGVGPGQFEYELTRERAAVVQEELDQLLRRYDKRAGFFESEDQLGEAILYYRLALKLDPEQAPTLERVQRLARVLDQRVREERAGLERGLEEGELSEASVHASRLQRLDPFDPGTQVAIRRAREAVGFEVTRQLEAGKHYYSHGSRERAEKAFQAVLDVDPTNQIALGYLSYIQRFDALKAQNQIPPPLRAISQEEILAEGHFRTGRRAEQNDAPFRALEEYQGALRVDPKHEAARRARDRLRKELRPRIEELYETGKRYFQDEDLQNAILVWRRILLIDPTHERTRENVARAERILARLEKIEAGGS